MREVMHKNLVLKMLVCVVKVESSILSTRLSKHWEQFDAYDPSQDNPPEPELTNQFVPGYEGYQRRVGEMIKEQHRRIFG